MDVTQTADGALDQTGTQTAEAVDSAVATPTEAASAFTLTKEEFEAQLNKAKNDAFNAGKQNRDKELRIERGSEEAVKRYHADVVNRLARGENPEDVLKDTPLIVKANREAVEIDLYQRLFETAKAQDPDAVAPLEGFASQDGLTAENWQGLAQAALDAVTNAAKKTSLSEWLDSDSLEDIDTNSKRYKALEAKFLKELGDEKKAMELENKTKPAVAPTTPSGVATEPMTRARLEAMTPNERLEHILTLDDDARASLWEMVSA